MNGSIIITAGGIGTRMNAELPKQFLPLNGKPILLLTLEKFYSYSPNFTLIITLPSDWMAYWKSLLIELNCEIPHILVEGGKERFDSIKNALAHCRGEYIGVHDAVRPFVSHETIQRCIQGLQKSESVVPVLELKDSLRKMEGSNSIMLDRKAYRLVHTPQFFHLSTLKKAYEIDFEPSFTDDASVVERIGISPYLVESNEENFKITSPIDYQLALSRFQN